MVSDYDTYGQISIEKSNTWTLEFAVFLAFCLEISGDSLQGLQKNPSIAWAHK
jgi:hypothetical protein